ncbi:BIG/ATPase V1 complex, subunit S1 [Lineolata rhizophorae]|uniref:Protein BIG1 n=1 Tax=Lineolata rhizophorae TaxID=578093 RepID=A0A6A6NL96_9PEZI|nr:BIG/ATPase V1 complex, subunit S1 [Lineolata rhizophorae]
MAPRASLAAALALAVASVSAFSDASPLFLFSDSPLASNGLNQTQIAASARIAARLSDTLSSCPSDSYVVVSQPQVAAADFEPRDAARHLGQRLADAGAEGNAAWTIRDVVGGLDAEEIAAEIERNCGARRMGVDVSTGSIALDSLYPRVIKLDFPPLPHTQPDRGLELEQHDSLLNLLMANIGAHHTVIFATTPVLLADTPPSVAASDEHAQVYNMDDAEQQQAAFPAGQQQQQHFELKRDLLAHTARSNLNSSLPLFEKYQYLSPGIFMGGMVSLFLLLILYVAVTAISSLQVTYFAFSKEMGPSAQKKQQ